MCVCVYSRIIIIVESAVRGKRKEGEEGMRGKKLSNSTKTHKFSIRFFSRCDFEEFLFTFQVCAPQRAEQKERERERGRGRERARALTRSFPDTLSLIARVAGAL